MRRMAFIPLTLLLLCFSCGSYSIREQAIRSEVPESYKVWTGGIRTQLTEQEVSEAIAFGQTSKENADRLEYAYIYKPEGLDWYIRVRTPSYLLAQHAFQQSREYRQVDAGFVDYCRNLAVAAIDVNEQTMRNDFSVRVQKYDVILLRDGIRVEPVADFPAYKGDNPFVIVDPRIKKIIQDSRKQSEQVMAALPPEQRAMMQNAMNVSSPVPSASPNVFSVQDLTRPGTYEVVVRTRETNNLFLPGGKEIRFPIDFRKFK